MLALQDSSVTLTSEWFAATHGSSRPTSHSIMLRPARQINYDSKTLRPITLMDLSCFR